MIVGDLHLPLLRPQQRLGNLGNIMPLGLRPMEKVAGARLLHDIWPGETSHLTEAIIAVDDGTVLYSGICNDKFFILPFKFPYDGPQEGVLRCHMPPANRHVARVFAERSELGVLPGCLPG